MSASESAYNYNSELHAAITEGESLRLRHPQVEQADKRSAEIQRDTNGRFTNASRSELADEQAEEDEIDGALREIENQRQENGTRAWTWETPLPGIDEETAARAQRSSDFTGLTDSELEATVEAARRRNEYVMELTELEKKIKGGGRKLLSESITGEEEDNLEEVEEMLSALGDGESVPDNLDALERLHACVSVERLQPTLYEKLGLKKPIGTMDKLVKEIQTAYPKEIVLLKEKSRSGGRDVMKTVKRVMSTVMVGTGINKVLMAMVASRIWAAEVGQRCSRAVRDVTQSICRVDIAEWSTIQEECESGEVRHALLTDEDASKGAGYGHFQARAGSSAKRLGDSWMKLVVMTVVCWGTQLWNRRQ